MVLALEQAQEAGALLAKLGLVPREGIQSASGGRLDLVVQVGKVQGGGRGSLRALDLFRAQPEFGGQEVAAAASVGGGLLIGLRDVLDLRGGGGGLIQASGDLRGSLGDQGIARGLRHGAGEVAIGAVVIGQALEVDLGEVEMHLGAVRSGLQLADRQVVHVRDDGPLCASRGQVEQDLPRLRVHVVRADGLEQVGARGLSRLGEGLALELLFEEHGAAVGHLGAQDRRERKIAQLIENVALVLLAAGTVVEAGELEQGALGVGGPAEGLLEHPLGTFGLAELEQGTGGGGRVVGGPVGLHLLAGGGGDQRNDRLVETGLSREQASQALVRVGEFFVETDGATVDGLGFGLVLFVGGEQVAEQGQQGRAVLGLDRLGTLEQTGAHVDDGIRSREQHARLVARLDELGGLGQVGVEEVIGRLVRLSHRAFEQLADADLGLGPAGEVTFALESGRAHLEDADEVVVSLLRVVPVRQGGESALGKVTRALEQRVHLCGFFWVVAVIA